MSWCDCSWRWRWRCSCSRSRPFLISNKNIILEPSLKLICVCIGAKSSDNFGTTTSTAVLGAVVDYNSIEIHILISLSYFPSLCTSLTPGTSSSSASNSVVKYPTPTGGSNFIVQAGTSLSFWSSSGNNEVTSCELNIFDTWISLKQFLVSF